MAAEKEHAPKTLTHVADVDGQPANIVHDAPLPLDITSTLTDETVLRSMSEAKAIYDAAKIPHRATTEALTKAKKEYERTCTVATAHFRSTRQIELELDESDPGGDGD